MMKLIAALAIAAAVSAPIAHADPSDDTAFVQALASRGLNCDTVKICGNTEDTSNLVTLGKLICATLNRDGGNVPGATDAVARGDTLSHDDAAFIVNHAINYYCPAFQR